MIGTLRIIRDWSPFDVASPGQHGPAPRAVTSLPGIGDRLRAAAFAEIQAREAFLWAADRFVDAPDSLKTAWRGLAMAEDRHLSWLLKRLQELNLSVTERKVSDMLWDSLTSCQSARDFAKYMASAEERGRKAGERFHQAMLPVDPITAEIFRKIAEEEVAHIQLAGIYFPEAETESPHSVNSR